MAQKINEVGLLLVKETKNVIFKERSLKNIYLNGDDVISVEYEKISDEGTKTEIATISFDNFSSVVENMIWNLIDQSKE
ncbi:hypothetical protein [Enterococcus casseliflavus]|uniref:hypothetical protein n=1 Tax=Enterococcus casseliflavus TaxID=37734 RepID=UPI0022E0F0AD|nr:hypothetical protein [Enterococcus casseliflavus]